MCRERHQQTTARVGRAEVERTAEREIVAGDAEHTGACAARDLRSAVARAAVDDQHLDAAIAGPLSGQQLEAAADRRGLVAGADDHADLWFVPQARPEASHGPVGCRLT